MNTGIGSRRQRSSTPANHRIARTGRMLAHRRGGGYKTGANRSAAGDGEEKRPRHRAGCVVFGNVGGEKRIMMRRSVLIGAGWCVVCVGARGQDRDFSQVEIKPELVRDGVYMLTGAGGNIGLSVGSDGAFMIDDQFAPLTDKIAAAVAKLSTEPVKFLINTHWHFDHTGGNENFGKAGAIIVAHENVRKAMSSDQFLEAFKQRVPASPPKALPVVTFAESLTFHWNGDEIRVLHVSPAHTDGDSVIHFKRANVVHTGDIYFNGMYPFIDTDHGGSLEGMIGAADRVLALCAEDTKIIPGHGPLSGVAELKAYRAMLIAARDAIAPLVKAGKSREEIVAAKPTRDLDAKWGQGFMQPDVWVGIVVDGMKKR